MSIGIRIDVFDPKEQASLFENLHKKEFEVFNYHTKDSKPIKIALMGLPLMEIPHLKQLLKDVGITPDEIKPLKLRFENYLYILYFGPRSVKLGDLKKTRYIGNFSIKWDHFQNRRQGIVAQCRNCQMFGHSSVNCRRKTRCLTCAGMHSTNNCPVKIPKSQLVTMDSSQIDRTKIKCVNCEQNHTANFSGCTKRIKYLEIMQRKNQKNRISTSPNFHFNSNSFPALPSNHEQKERRFIHTSFPRKSFSSTLRGQANNQPVLRQENSNLFSPEELMIIFKDIIMNLQGCTSKMEQILKLGEIATKYLFTDAA